MVATDHRSLGPLRPVSSCDECQRIRTLRLHFVTWPTRASLRTSALHMPTGRGRWSLLVESTASHLRRALGRTARVNHRRAHPSLSTGALVEQRRFGATGWQPGPSAECSLQSIPSSSTVTRGVKCPLLWLGNRYHFWSDRPCPTATEKRFARLRSIGNF